MSLPEHTQLESHADTILDSEPIYGYEQYITDQLLVSQES